MAHLPFAVFGALSLSLASASAAPQCGDRELALPGEDFLRLMGGPNSLLAFDSDGFTTWTHDGFSWIRTLLSSPFAYPMPAMGALSGKIGGATNGTTVAIMHHDGETSNHPTVHIVVYEWDGSAWSVVLDDYTGPWGWGSNSSIHQSSTAVHESGSLMVLGAPGMNYGQGLLAFLERTSTGWARTFELGFPTAHPGWRGCAVDFDGDWLYVGAAGSVLSSAAQGVVGLYEVAGGSLTGYREVVGISPSDSATLGFGLHLTADDGLLVVASQSGGLEVHERVGEQHSLVQSIALPAPYTGQVPSELSLYGGHLIVGVSAAGAVLEYMWDGSSFVQVGVRTNLDSRGGEMALRTPFGVVSRSSGSLVAETEHTFIRSVCRCDAAGACGNPSASAGCINSTGVGASLKACGSTRTSADDLSLTASGLPAGSFAIPLMGRATAGTTLGNGTLCLGGNILRYPVEAVTGGAVEVTGLVATSQANHPAASAISPGQTWTLQVWYRDVGGPCGGGSNLTDALTITFTP